MRLYCMWLGDADVGDSQAAPKPLVPTTDCKGPNTSASDQAAAPSAVDAPLLHTAECAGFLYRNFGIYQSYQIVRYTTVFTG